MANEPLRLTRDQLAKFLPDHEAIRRFEKLFSIVETVAPDVINEVSNAAENAGSRATQALGEISRLANALEFLALAPQSQLTTPDFIERAPTEFPPPRYGSFYDTTTQTPAAINTAYAITFNTTDVAFGVYRGATTSQIFVTSPGVYNIQFSAQLDNTSGGNHIIYIWLRVNGVDVANSASQVRLKGTDAELVAAWNFAASLKAGDYFQLMYSATDTAVQILAQVAAAPVPDIPSIILTVQEISK
jgi:hypothetical protein